MGQECTDAVEKSLQARAGMRGTNGREKSENQRVVTQALHLPKNECFSCGKEDISEKLKPKISGYDSFH